MQQLKLIEKVKINLFDFIEGLKVIYKEELVSVILYGSAVSGEFITERSNLNLLVVLKNIELDNLAKVSGLVNKARYRMVHSLFFSPEYIKSSLDVFPIEFLDMKENYQLLFGEDILKNLVIDLKNLRFQCEHELKAKLINLRQAFLSLNKNKAVSRDILFKSFSSILHILRNIVRIKGKEPRYLKQDIIKQIKEELPINIVVWEKILAAKNKAVNLSSEEIKPLFALFVADLDNLANLLDKL